MTRSEGIQAALGRFAGLGGRQKGFGRHGRFRLRCLFSSGPGSGPRAGERPPAKSAAQRRRQKPKPEPSAALSALKLLFMSMLAVDNMLRRPGGQQRTWKNLQDAAEGARRRPGEEEAQFRV